MGQEKWALAASFPRVQLLQKGAIKLSPLPTGCLPTPLQWKEIPMRGVQLPEPCLEGCPPPGSLATGPSIISFAFPAPQLLRSCQAGLRHVFFPDLILGICYWLVVKLLPQETGIIQTHLLREAAALYPVWGTSWYHQHGDSLSTFSSVADHCPCCDHEGLPALWIKELKAALKQALWGQKVAEIQVHLYAYHVLKVCSLPMNFTWNVKLET